MICWFLFRNKINLRLFFFCFDSLVFNSVLFPVALLERLTPVFTNNNKCTKVCRKKKIYMYFFSANAPWSLDLGCNARLLQTLPSVLCPYQDTGFQLGLFHTGIETMRWNFFFFFKKTNSHWPERFLLIVYQSKQPLVSIQPAPTQMSDWNPMFSL